MTRLPVLVLFTIVALLGPACSAFGPTVVGSGNAKTEQRSVGDFTRVRVGTAINATVIGGPAISVSVTADDNLLANVRTDVTAGRLTVEIQGSTMPRTPVTVTITAPSLEGAEATSAANVTVTGVNAGSFSAAADSAATLVVRGNATSVDVKASSAANADLGGVPARTATVKADSAGRATVNAQQSVTGSVESGGVVRVEGSPPTVNVSTASGGVVVRD
jgi:hypothetical protein